MKTGFPYVLYALALSKAGKHKKIDFLLLSFLSLLLDQDGFWFLRTSSFKASSFKLQVLSPSNLNVELE